MLGTLLTIILVCFAAVQYVRRRRRNLPPGPPGLPIIGNIFDIPTAKEWLTYQAWGYRYKSDIIYLRLLGTEVVVVNTTKAARDIFEKRSRNYSDKFESVMVHELTGWGRSMVFVGYTDKWRIQRRMFHEYFRPNALSTYHPRITTSVRKCLRMLLDEPENFIEHLRFMTGSTILDIVYGLDIKPHNDPYIKTVERSVQILSQIGQAGAFLVDLIPTLKYIPEWFPGAGFKRQAAVWKPTVDAMYLDPYRAVKKAYDDNRAKPCMVTSILDRIGKQGLSEYLEEAIINLSGLTYAGADTTVSTLSTVLLTMLLFPDVQARAKEELDIVVGNARLPTLDDRDSLPYITAIIKEALR